MQKMVLLPYDRYQRLLSVQEHTPPLDIIDQEETDNNLEDKVPIQKEDVSELIPDVQKVATLFPKSLRGRALALLTYVVPYVGWDSKLEATLSGEKIPHSNIVDLIKVQIKEYKDFCPVGTEKFERLLKDINVPLSLLSRVRREQEGRGNIPPPPGTPIKRKVEAERSVNLKWLKL